jgi:uncharacterized protein
VPLPSALFVGARPLDGIARVAPSRASKAEKSSAVPEIAIRLATAADAPFVLRINEDAAPGVSRLTPFELTALGVVATPFLVAEVADRVVGYLIAMTSDAVYEGDEFSWFRSSIGDGFLYIDQIAVAGGWRGRGIGSALYLYLERWAVASGLRLIACEINLSPPNPGSIRFHQQRGFVELGTMETRDGRTVSLRGKAVE